MTTPLMITAAIVGAEVNGARRWLDFGMRFQPSEFLKPFFIVSTAWILSLRAQDDKLPVMPITAALTGAIVFLLMLQPDFGQTIVFASVWLILLLIAGISPKMMATLGAAGIGGVVAAYLFYGTARARIDSFLFGAPGGYTQNLYQTDFDDPDRENPFDFNAFKDDALPNEGNTAGGDSGGPLILDQTFDEKTILGVLSVW